MRKFLDRLPEYTAERRRIVLLHTLLERLQVAPSGSLAFDAAIVDAFGGLPGIGAQGGQDGPLSPGPHCSTALVDVMGLLPADYNFSLGRRDGVCWAWIQPNDFWRPGDGESRHDHPGGSGLTVADTPVLAVACAAIRLHLRAIEHRRRAALHRLTYVSRSRMADPCELRSLVAIARASNERDGITGALLLFEDGLFCQVLEGAFTKVEASFSRISRDPRHEAVRILQAAPAPHRSYPGWPMGFATLDHAAPCLEGDPDLAARAMLDTLVAAQYRAQHWVDL